MLGHLGSANNDARHGLQVRGRTNLPTTIALLHYGKVGDGPAIHHGPERLGSSTSSKLVEAMTRLSRLWRHASLCSLTKR